MSIESLNTLDPESYLEKVEATPYPLKEKVIDLAFFFRRIVGSTLIGSLTQPIQTLKTTVAYLFIRPNLFPRSHFITMESIQEHCSKNKCPKDFEETLTYVVAKTQELTKKMGMGEVQIEICQEDVALLARSFKGYNIRIITLGKRFFENSRKEMECILVHELSHLKHNDVLKNLVFDWVVMALNFTAFRHFNFLRAVGVVMLTRGVFDGIFRVALARYMELAADREALHYLNSNIAMVEAFHRELKEQYTFKHTPAEELHKTYPIATVEDIKLDQMEITPYGNVRGAPVQTTARLAQALNFKPVLV